MRPTRSLSLLLCLGGLGCSAYDNMRESADDMAESAGGAFDTGQGDHGSEDEGLGEDPYEAEDEDAFVALLPAVTDTYVFVANPSRGTVTRIGVPSLAVITAEVGVNPLSVQTTPDNSLAVVLNAGTDDASLVDTDTLEVRSVEVRPHLNAMVMSPTGSHALVWYDADGEREDDGGVQSFNEVSLLDLDSGTAETLIVGAHPRDVQFTDEGDRVVVESDDYLSIIELWGAEPTVERLPISEDLVDPPQAEELLLTPGGEFAFVRQFGATELVVVDLLTQAVDQVAVGDNPTDLDATPDGLQAVAVARGASELWIYDLADPFAEAKVVPLPPDNVFGSILMSPDGTQGLLYSTAANEPVYASWDRSDDQVVLRGLPKAVAGMGVSPDGATAVIFHSNQNPADMTQDSEFWNAWALTMVDLAAFFPHSLKLPAEPTEWDHTADGSLGFFIMDGEPNLVMLDYASLGHEDLPLKSAPVHVGVLEDTHTAFVSQAHELGRISFYNADEDHLQTVTGFELNAGIED